MALFGREGTKRSNLKRDIFKFGKWVGDKIQPVPSVALYLGYLHLQYLVVIVDPSTERYVFVLRKRNMESMRETMHAFLVAKEFQLSIRYYNYFCIKKSEKQARPTL